MTAARIIAGVCALLFGRRLFWLFVGAVGFVLGMDVATRMFWGASEPVIVGVALLAGVIGAALTTVLYEVMVAVAGFVTGSYLGVQLLMAVMPYPGRSVWIAAVVGGIIGVLLLNALFNWAVIVISSLVGAGFIVSALHVAPRAEHLLFLVLVTVGVAAQASTGRRRRRTALV